MAKGTFLYPSLVSKLGGGSTPANTPTLNGNNTFTGSNTFNIISVPTPTNNNNATPKSYVDNAVNGCAKLASDNTFTGTNTFSAPVVANGNLALKTTQTDITLLEQTNQSGKQINLDFIQPSGAYKNYCSLAVRYKYQSQNIVELIKFENRPDGNEGVYITSSLNKFDFGNKELTSIGNPTTNTSAVNKQYVDGRTTTYKWEGSVNGGSDQELATISWDKHIIGAVVFRKRNDGQWFSINHNMTQELYRLDNTGQFKLYGADVSGANPGWTNQYRVYITYIN